MTIGFVPRIGFLVLDTAFERIPGDAGHADTWPFEVTYGVVRGADPRRVIDRPDPELLQVFHVAARELVEAGVDAIGTTCGFLALYQQELARDLPVPVATSSLLQVPLLERVLPAGRTVGIVTMDPARLTSSHLAAVGIARPVAMEGLPRDGAFWAMICHGQAASPEILAREVEDAGRRLIDCEPSIGAIVLECANMPPYAQRLAAALGLPVFDIVTLVEWLVAGLRPAGFPRKPRPPEAEA
jgi:hypothetical protein